MHVGSVRLLRLIRADRVRANAPALVVATERRRKSLNHTSSRSARAWLICRRCLGILGRASLDIDEHLGRPAKCLMVPGGGHKHAEVIDELQSATRGADWNGAQRVRQVAAWRVTWQGVVVALRLLPVLVALYKRPRLRPYTEVIVRAIAMKQILGRGQGPGAWLIIGDLNTRLIALAWAASEVGHRVVYWQYSYLDFKPLPVRADYAVLLNETGRKLAGLEGYDDSNRRVFWRPGLSIEALRLDCMEEGPFGAFLNVHAHQESMDRLGELADAWNAPIEVRLHPNSTPSQFQWPSGLTLADSEEPLEAFVRRISLAVCGNTQAQAKALCMGTPVVQCEGLDVLPFDHHRYVSWGVVPGKRAGEHMSLQSVRAFYLSGSYVKPLRSLLGPDPANREPGLREFLEAVTGHQG